MAHLWVLVGPLLLAAAILLVAAYAVRKYLSK